MTQLQTVLNSDDVVTVAKLSAAEQAEFVEQRELFHHAVEQGMAGVRQRHADLIRAGLMREDFSLIQPPALDTAQE